MRRVAVTGVGVISALGANCAAFWKSLSDGVSGIGPITAVDCSPLRFANGAEVRGFDPFLHFDPKVAMQLDRSVQLAGVAAAEALRTSSLHPQPERTAVVTGCCVGGKWTEDETYRQLYAEKKTRFDPLTIPRVMANGSASWISMHHGITGPAYTVSTACASAAHAIGQAFWMVRSGMVDAAVAGGNEAPFAFGMLRGWEAMRVVSPDTCRPFTLDRKGLILGEGAAMLVLEPLESARARGAHVIAEICGFGMTSDASHITMPSAEGAAAAIRAALADGGLAPEQIGYINAHGTGTPANDSTETKAIRSVFAAPPPVSSTKSMHGHTLGAAGALEAAAVLMAFERDLLPPTANFTQPDPACDLDVIPNEARAGQVEAALSNSFAFGGLNAVLAFRHAD
ncbi:beta-ketoacyl-[acyl-carrier-protein] synthase family protein [uncultured Paludibaculum sp.]|uniref:beta-ketoacyl-[acyl-carrier-protein] synthase family protein n=1 Tax=uncultured Paludibaculum sp. TaxID=1765020 RepID=UPI002AAA8BB9|nr:beta-ketoacyl-[acyl-carrier-protein] synthase family protein [uncultured Paludibaculum sp.]